MMASGFSHFECAFAEPRKGREDYMSFHLWNEAIMEKLSFKNKLMKWGAYSKIFRWRLSIALWQMECFYFDDVSDRFAILTWLFEKAMP